METATTPPLSDYEIERGKPMPSFNHAIVQSRLIGEFLAFKDFDIASELKLDVQGKPFTPDISVFKRRTKDWLHDQVEVAEPPLLTVEILSPTQGFNSVSAKLDAYFSHGILSVWVVHPEIQTVTVFESLTQQKTSSSGVITDPATGITADLAKVFA